MSSQLASECSTLDRPNLAYFLIPVRLRRRAKMSTAVSNTSVMAIIPTAVDIIHFLENISTALRMHPKTYRVFLEERKDI